MGPLLLWNIHRKLTPTQISHTHSYTHTQTCIFFTIFPPIPQPPGLHTYTLSPMNCLEDLKLWQRELKYVQKPHPASLSLLSRDSCISTQAGRLGVCVSVSHSLQLCTWNCSHSGMAVNPHTCSHLRPRASGWPPPRLLLFHPSSHSTDISWVSRGGRKESFSSE